ncbi:MAG: sodium:proton antiporter [Chloroflexi bacterium]|nr:sodium:proton antiporter [Chloroflexota bacterium]
MNETLTIAVVAGCVLAFSLISKRIQRTIITAPMVFVAFGLLLSENFLGIVPTTINPEFVNLVAELTLVLVLFTDASRIDLSLLRRDRNYNLPVRMLVIGLPLTILAGAAVALIIFGDLELWEAFVLATILAPTDAALAQAVISLPGVPARIRQSLNVESGLNDGLALPILLLFVSLASSAEAQPVGDWIEFAALQLIMGPLVGIIVGYVGGRALRWVQRREWVSEAFEGLGALSLALLGFAAAELVGGNGFVAAFFAGVVFGNVARNVCSMIYGFAESEGQLLTLITFLIFGAVLVPEIFGHVDLPMIGFAVLSLTLIRMIPVALSLWGTGLMRDTVVFLGWFGPRGVASILYGLLVLEESDLPHGETLLVAMIVTVLISVFAHGITAVPGVTLYVNRLEEMDEDELEEMAEMREVPEMPTRISM